MEQTIREAELVMRATQAEIERDLLREHLRIAMQQVARAQRAGLPIDEQWVAYAREAAGLER